MRHGVLARETSGALQLGGGALDRRARSRELGAQPVGLRFERPRIDLEEQIAAADDRALFEADGGDESGHARPDRDGVHRLEAAGHFVPLGDIA